MTLDSNKVRLVMSDPVQLQSEPEAVKIPPFISTPVDHIPVIRATLKNAFKTGRTKSIQFRRQQLLSLAYLIKDNFHLFQQALASDLGRSHHETTILELGSTLTEVMTAYHNVAKWSKPEKARWSLNYFAMNPTIRKEPKGVVLIISPFNYPLWVSLGPFAGAIAAGNACTLKPSELTPAFSALLAELFPKYLDPDLYTVINGAIPEATKLLEFQWDHILFTGGSRIASIVLTAAAKTLSPVSTELGGKSPAVIDPNCDLKLTARRLVWGKVANAGQTCIAPDYALVPKSIVDQFVQACKDVLSDFYPEGAESSDSFARIVSPSHFNRIKGLLDRTEGEIVYGGGMNSQTKFIEPTIVTGVKGNDSLMGEEIFGPILPVIEVENVDEAIDFINARDHPLSLYVFSSNRAFKDKVAENTQSGAVVMNDTLTHCVAEGLPFGGIGPSGSGYHTGKYSFDMFTHLRSTLDNPTFLERLLWARYPPYNEQKAKSFMLLTLPSMPARTAAGGYAGSKRWGPLLIASVVAVSSFVLLIGRPRLVRA
ncbi:NAD-aldehyde dehydrogenase [Russula earlei]|uniref:NAD-aldehyde dehydrogenase n=1 Tax=Russula earlei TaxID=71964 RepID=A0ACC0UCR5_9AGAM|nr:NAD-aldehyde dehydrogenase [Russula earlei]